MTVLVPLPQNDFDPTEAAVPWNILTRANHRVIFATPTGEPAAADPRVLTGRGFGPLAPLLAAGQDAVSNYRSMESAQEFRNPIAYEKIVEVQVNALLLPGGHAPGMKPYLESTILQKTVSHFFAQKKPVAAICHGVVLASRSIRTDGLSVLHGLKTTALLKRQELTAWGLTRLWLGSYYRTYPETVEDEVKRCLAVPSDFVPGPFPVRRDSDGDLAPGFVVKDGNYLSARWPGDAHALGQALLKLL